VDRPGGQLVMAVCIDNLVKGAAGQAIQNFNVAFGFDEAAGLRWGASGCGGVRPVTGCHAGMTTVLKLGGELLEDAVSIARGRDAIARLAARGPLVVVHGGGRAVDAEIACAREQPRFVDGLRVTDGRRCGPPWPCWPAGRTRRSPRPSALLAPGGRPDGSRCGHRPVARAGAFRTVAATMSTSGWWASRAPPDMTLLRDLLTLGYVPIVASIGVSPRGTAERERRHIGRAPGGGAAGAAELIIAGAPPACSTAAGRPSRTCHAAGMDALIASGAAHSGMVAKLAACRAALRVASRASPS
jgi:acetylglutamate kinase